MAPPPPRQWPPDETTTAPASHSATLQATGTPQGVRKQATQKTPTAAGGDTAARPSGSRGTLIAEEAIEVFQAALDDEAIAHRLSRKAYAEHGADTLEVLQEWPILERIDGQLVRGRIDRMVVGRRGGEIVFIDIVDFKSGRIDDDQAEADAIEYYRPQVEFYVESALVHFELDPATVTGRLLFIEAGRDLPCTPCPTAPSSS